MPITLDNLTKEELKAVGKNVRNLRRLDKELGIKPTKEQKVTRWRCLVEAEIGLSVYNEKHQADETEA